MLRKKKMFLLVTINQEQISKFNISHHNFSVQKKWISAMFSMKSETQEKNCNSGFSSKILMKNYYWKFWYYWICLITNPQLPAALLMKLHQFNIFLWKSSKKHQKILTQKFTGAGCKHFLKNYFQKTSAQDWHSGTGVHKFYFFA